jgi:hypothetical protein
MKFSVVALALSYVALVFSAPIPTPKASENASLGALVSTLYPCIYQWESELTSLALFSGSRHFGFT